MAEKGRERLFWLGKGAKKFAELLSKAEGRTRGNQHLVDTGCGMTISCMPFHCSEIILYHVLNRRAGNRERSFWAVGSVISPFLP